jgi:HD-GYP domain-containing protein (c-di-GMP phosphodiesterase class II)/HAMP domain-containing protein
MRGPFRKLQWKIFTFLAVSLVLLIGLFAFFYQRFLTSRVIRQAAAHSELVADTIHLGLAQNMISNHREGIQLSLEDVIVNPMISEIVIADGEDRVVYSTRPELVGRGLLQAPFEVLGRNERWKVIRSQNGEGREIFRVMSIPNREACHECHSPSQFSLGKIALRMSLEDSDSLLRESRYYLASLVCLILAILFMVNARFFSVNVMVPIEKLRKRFQEVEKGNMLRPPGDEKEVVGELGELSARFEKLVGEIHRLHEREKVEEKNSALTQRDRSHREELERVNLKLVEKVAALNLANSRISKLAGQLEERNEKLQGAVKSISALNRVGVALSSELDIDRLVTLLINISVKGLRAEVGHIMLLDKKSGRLVMKAWTGMGEDFDPNWTVAPGESVSGLVVKSGKAMLLPKVNGRGAIKTVSRYGFTRRTVISAPIRIKDRTLGVIELTNKRGDDSFSEEDLGMMQSIANQAAVAIENANLYMEVQKSYFDTIKALVQAVEETDKYTRGHSERVTTFSVKIAVSMGLNEKQLENIRYGGVLHDIGKIGINVNIIQKPGRLTKEEYSLIKHHPLIGERIIGPIEFLSGVLPVISQHHERYDGSGYPLGLNGSSMVVEARVLGVADAYDAMITDRPYRNPLPRSEAIAELRRCSGTQFDPIVVEHFLAILEEDPDIRKLEESLSTVGT